MNISYKSSQFNSLYNFLMILLLFRAVKGSIILIGLASNHNDGDKFSSSLLLKNNVLSAA